MESKVGKDIYCKHSLLVLTCRTKLSLNAASLVPSTRLSLSVLIMHMQNLPLEVLSSSSSDSTDVTDTIVLTTFLASLESFHATTVLPSSPETSTRVSLSSLGESSQPSLQRSSVSDLPNATTSRRSSSHTGLSRDP